MGDVILSLEHITKLYPGVVALDDVSMSFERGEVHALVGENGAGKSTLIKVVAGAIHPDAGTVRFEGESCERLEPHKVRELGIEVVYQEFNLAPTLAVYENIFMGQPLKKGPLVDHKGMIRATREIFHELEIDIDPEARVSDLTVAYMQFVEIAKAISKKAKVLIMDEPTATLTNKEVEILFKVVNKIRAEGVLVIYVSHRMEEIFPRKFSKSATV